MRVHVGGNSGGGSRPERGEIALFDDLAALTKALDRALAPYRDTQRIRACTEENPWDHQAAVLGQTFSSTLKPPNLIQPCQG